MTQDKNLLPSSSLPMDDANGLSKEPLSFSKRTLLRAGLGLSLFGLSLHKASAAEAGLEQFYKFNIKPDTWLAEVFGGQVPPPQVVETSGKSVGLMQSLPQRLRYWRANGRTAWIFDDVGKEGYAPTTCGFVVKGGVIEAAKVLIYRESRGEQVGQPSFLQQLTGARAAGAALDKKVDNISGATYSVKMMERMAKAALVLDSSVPA